MKRRSLIVLVALTVALVVTACQPGASAGPSSDLVGSTWQWTASQETNPPSQAVVPDPENYTIEFLADGTVNVKADCNQMSGTYTVAVPLDLTITLGTSTLAFCGEASLDALFVDYLGRVATYSVSGGELELDFVDDGGSMQFTATGS